jgi:hypothetical protein
VRIQTLDMALRAGSGTEGGEMPVLGAVRDVAPVAQCSAVVEPGIVVDAGGANWGVNAAVIRAASATSISCPSPLPAAGPW